MHHVTVSIGCLTPILHAIRLHRFLEAIVNKKLAVFAFLVLSWGILGAMGIGGAVVAAYVWTGQTIDWNYSYLAAKIGLVFMECLFALFSVFFRITIGTWPWNQ